MGNTCTFLSKPLCRRGFHICRLFLGWAGRQGGRGAASLLLHLLAPWESHLWHNNACTELGPKPVRDRSHLMELLQCTKSKHELYTKAGKIRGCAGMESSPIGSVYMATSHIGKRVWRGLSGAVWNENSVTLFSFDTSWGQVMHALWWVSALNISFKSSNKSYFRRKKLPWHSLIWNDLTLVFLLRTTMCFQVGIKNPVEADAVKDLCKAYFKTHCTSQMAIVCAKCCTLIGKF